MLYLFVGKDEESDCYACLIPIMKAALEKAGWDLEFEPIHAVLSLPDEVLSDKQPLSKNLFDQFQLIIQQESWKLWIEDKVMLKPYIRTFVHALKPMCNKFAFFGSVISISNLLTVI